MFLLVLVDLLISSVIILPLIISFWRGAWEFLNYSGVFPIFWTLLISTVIHIFLTIFREVLYEKRCSGFLGIIVSRIYIYCFSIVCILQWRGLFYLLDNYFNLKTASIAAAASTIVFMGIRGVGSLVGVPFVLCLDHRQKAVFIYPTLFQKKSAENVWMYVLDCAFSVCVIGTLVVFVWRGSWSLLDAFLCPDNTVLSAWASLGLGYSIVAITFLLQPAIKYLAKTLSGISRTLAVDLYLLFSFCGTVNVWRGVWNLLNVYFFPRNPLLSYLLSHAVPFLLLVLINSSNSILVRGVYIDGEEAGSQCVDFPCYYLRLFFQAKRKKKLLKEAGKRQGGRSDGELLSAAVERRKSASNLSPEVNQLLATP